MIGIDLGTTNSCVFFTNARGDLERVPVSSGNEPYDTVLASIVLDPIGPEPDVGLRARNEHTTRPEATLMSYFKHLLDVQQLRELRPVKRLVRTRQYDWVNEGDLVREETRWEETGGDYSRDEVVGACARVLEVLLRRAWERGADRESEIWLGVPVSFSSRARKRLLCALTRTRDESGEPIFPECRDLLRQVHFVLEPVAVAAAPQEDLAVTGTETVLIFDHGGGTLDLSLIEYEQNPRGGPPVPRRELGAGGAVDVAGRDIDRAFHDYLWTDPEIVESLGEIEEGQRREAIEACKRALSTRHIARLPFTDHEIPRGALEAAIQPILGRIEDEVRRTVSAAGLTSENVDWVVMTGGSSLVPAVQDRIMGIFIRAAERDQVLRYFAEDTDAGGGVESAITDVAQGLARFGDQRTLEQIVLWDIELGRDGDAGFSVLIERGTPFEAGPDASRELVRVVPAGDVERDGASFGLYERQLDHRYVFGLADAPVLPEEAQLLIKLRPDAAFPLVAVVDPATRRALAHPDPPRGWDSDEYLIADLYGRSEEELADFFDSDAEYLPATGFRSFELAPLVRKLRRGDFVEWSRVARGNGWINRRGRGKITSIRAIGDDEELNEMASWDVSKHVIKVRDADTGALVHLGARNGWIRLSPNPAKIYAA